MKADEREKTTWVHPSAHASLSVEASAIWDLRFGTSNNFERQMYWIEVSLRMVLNRSLPLIKIHDWSALSSWLLVFSNEAVARQ